MTNKNSKIATRESRLDRRRFLRTAGAASAAGLLAACDNAQSENPPAANGAPAILVQKRNLKMVTSWPKNFPGAGTSAERLALRIGEMTEGQINIRVFGAGELVPALGGFDAVSLGNADIYHGAEYYWQGRSPAFNFFAAVPFGMNAREMLAWMHYEGGQELWDQLSARFNIKPLMAGNTGVQMGGWFRNRINSIDDFRGLRFRIPGLGGEVFQRIGATPVTRPLGELFLALSQGNIDATEWVGPWNDMAAGFHTIIKNYYYPGIHEPGTALSVGFNLDVWESFTATQRAIISTAAAAETTMVYAEYEANNARALETLVNDHGVNVLPFSDEILRTLGEVSAEVLADTAASDPFTAEVFESFTTSMERQQGWNKISEIAYSGARSLLRQ